MFLYFPMWGGLFFPARKGATEEVSRLARPPPPPPPHPARAFNCVQCRLYT